MRLTGSFLFSLLLSSAALGQPLVRSAAMSLKMPADATTFPYKTEAAFGGLPFDQPVGVVFAPGATQRAFVVERAGRVVLVRDTATPTREVFLDLTGKVGNSGPDHGLLSLAFHPKFAENGYFYVWYSTFLDGQRANRLARFHVSSANPALADPDSETPLITQRTGAGGHDGGTLLFGADGYLYLSIGVGDGGDAEAIASHQRIDRSFFGAVLRIDVDQKPGNLAPNPHASVNAGTYSIPADNPFVGATTFNGQAVASTAVRTEFWAVGLRNPFRLTFDDTTGELWCADVGLNVREEIDLITRGGNYGWDYREGLLAGPQTAAPPAAANFIDPIWDYDHSQGLSITGGVVYRGNKFPELQGSYLFADFLSGRIWALQDNGTRPLPAAQVKQVAAEGGLTGFTTDPRTGDILVADFDSGLIKRLATNPNASGSPLPATLAATGAFSSVATLTPASGVVAYAPNVSFWSDYAKKTRWFALPDTTRTYTFSSDTNWTLPTGAVWIKHFDLELVRGNPATARRVETRLLVKTPTGVYGATYRWNDTQTDATLVPEDGADQVFQITENGVTRAQTWHFPGRGECLTCHTQQGGFALSFNTRQLNRDFTFAGGTTNQITALAQAGYLNPNSPPTPASLPALVSPDNPAAAIELRARSYLDANCAQCHQPGGTAQGSWDARASTPLALANIVNGLLATATSDPANRVLVPGDVTHSQLLARIAAAPGTRMPPLATNERDLAAESLLTQWIAALAVPQAPSRLVNLAARADVGTGGGIIIAGFVIAPGASKSVLVRAVGPTLAQLGVGGAVSRPVLTVLSGSNPIATNTGWSTAANASDIRTTAARIGAFALPEGSADSAVLLTLPPGPYTAQASGLNATTGVGLVEIYDADPSSTGSARLVNTAVRAQVGTGSSVLIPGLVVGAGATKTVLIRAIGPGLSLLGVGGPLLAEPVVTLFAGSQSYLSNAGWNSSSNPHEIRASAVAVGAFALPEGSRDSAILTALSPGAYTIQVSGKNDGTGVALVEVYEVP